MHRTTAILALLGVAASGHAYIVQRTASEPTKAVVTLRNAAGATVGTASLSQTNAGVLVTGVVRGIGAGTHAVHIHAVGRCEPPFTTAGGHFNPANRHHGFLSADGPHAGDATNISVPAADSLGFDLLFPAAKLDGTGGVLDTDGAALVIHAGADDYLSDPAGNAGARIACGVITAS